MGADQDAAMRALKRMRQQEDEAKGYYGTVSTPVPPAVADSIPNTLPAPDPADPSYVDHTQPTMADRTRAILQPSYDGAANLASKVKEKAADLDWRNVAKRGLEIAAGPLGLMHAANDKMNSLANRDGGAGQPPPAQPTEQPTQGGQAWGTPVQAQAQQQPEQTGSGEREVDYQLPISDAERMAGRGGGGSGKSDLEMARMAAGNIGITPQLQGATNQYKGTVQEGVGAVAGREAGMESALRSEAEARRNVAFTEEAKAVAVRNATNQRMAEEQQLRSQLQAASNISPDRYWDSQGGYGAKFAAGAGLLIAGLGGTKSVKMVLDNINHQIDRHVETQVASYNAKLGLAKEERAQWDARMQALNDEYAAKLSAKMQGVDMAKSYFLGQMNLAKTDEAKTNLALLADQLDLKNAQLQQELEMHTQQKLYERIHQREQAAQAAAQRAALWAREDRHRSEDKQFQERMLDKKLAEQEETARLRGSNSRGQSIDLRALAKQRAEIDPMVEDASRLEGEISSRGGPDDVLPGYGIGDSILSHAPFGIGQRLVGKEGTHNRQVVGMYTDMVNRAITGASSTDREQLRRLATMIGSGKREDVLTGIREFNQFMLDKRASVDAGYAPELVQEYERRRAAERGGR